MEELSEDEYMIKNPFGLYECEICRDIYFTIAPRKCDFCCKMVCTHCHYSQRDRDVSHILHYIVYCDECINKYEFNLYLFVLLLPF